MYSIYGTTHHKAGKHYAPDREKGKNPDDVWTMNILNPTAKERIGYPTQKPLEVVQRIVDVATDEGDVVADFFMGGGTTLAAAIGLRAEIGAPLQPTKYNVTRARRFIGCDQSRIAVAITADRLTTIVDDKVGNLFPVPDFTIEHWGVYEARRLAETPLDQFRHFVLRAFGAVSEENPEGFHGTKGAVPVWVGEPSPKVAVTAKEVQDFANAIRRTLRYRQDNLRDGIMLAWAFRPDALEAAERLRRLEMTDLNFIRLEQIRIDSPRFREHIAALSTDHADYQTFLTFVQAPRVEVGYKRVARHTFKFDVSDTIISNVGAKIINVQWDFSYRGRFTSTPGYSFVRGGNREPALQAEYTFPSAGKRKIACKVQDDLGGEGLWSAELDVD
jgi:hypothetical protein